MSDQDKKQDGAVVQAMFNYVDPLHVPQSGFAFTFDHDWSGIPFITREMRIEDASALRTPASLAVEGFQKVSLDGLELRDLDPADFEPRWGAAVCERIREATGADSVVRWAFSARFSERKTDARRSDVSNPARRVHGDFSPTEFGPVIRHRLCAEAIEAVARGRSLKRWIGINAWQPFSPPPYDIPLAVCDARSVTPDDLVIGRGSTPSNPDLAIDLPLFSYSPTHRWFYYSAYAPDEVLLFTGLDSAHPDDWRLVPHSAFDNPACPDDAAPRCSVEMRTMALFFE